MLQMKATEFLVSFTFAPLSLDLIFHSSFVSVGHVASRSAGLYRSQIKVKTFLDYQVKFGNHAIQFL